MATARPRIDIATPRRHRDAFQRASSTRAETTRRRRRRGRAMRDQRPPSPRLSEAALRRHAAAMRGERERAARAASALRRELDDFSRRGPKHDLHTPLHAACEDGEASTARALLVAGAAVDERDERGATALMTAAQWGHAEVCRLLLERGADANGKDEQGDTALHEAARANALDAAEVLGEWKGTNLEAKNAHGCTALHVASHSGHGAMVKLLVRLGAAVNGEMRGGYSALHVAAANGSSSSLSALLESGANIRHSASESNILRSASGTALELAEANDQVEAARLLRNASQREFEQGGLFGKE
jgi:ankyrin repeat protein